MGQVANDMINGLSCSECGIYFEESHGYPVVCSSCNDPEDDDQPPKATNKEL